VFWEPRAVPGLKHGKISRVKFEERIKEIIWRLLSKQNVQVKLLEIIVKEINK